LCLVYLECQLFKSQVDKVITLESKMSLVMVSLFS